MLRDIHHIGVAVRDLGRAADLYGGALGAELEGREVVAEQGVEVILCRVGGSRIELIAPLNPECAMAKFLEKRGEGVHHIAYHVESVREAIKKLSEAGLKLVDEEPRPGAHHTWVAFVHPKSTMGALWELVEEGRDD